MIFQQRIFCLKPYTVNLNTRKIIALSNNWKGLTSTFWAVVKITSFSDKDIDCITNTPLSNLRNLESNEINLHNVKKVQDFLSQTLKIHGTVLGKGSGPSFLLSTISTRHFSSDIYLQLLIIPFVTTRLLLDEIKHLLELSFN